MLPGPPGVSSAERRASSTTVVRWSFQAAGRRREREYADNDLTALSGKRRPQDEALRAAVDAGQVDRIVTYRGASWYSVGSVVLETVVET